MMLSACNAQPIKDSDDFSAVAFFFCEFEGMKQYFDKLEYRDLEDGEHNVSVQRTHREYTRSPAYLLLN